MEVTCSPGPREDQLIVVPQGDLDLYASVGFCTAVLSQMETGRRRVVLDFKEVRYLDSSGVGALIRLIQKARVLGGEVRMARLAGTPKKVLEMSNIITLLKLSTDVEAALKAWE